MEMKVGNTEAEKHALDRERVKSNEIGRQTKTLGRARNRTSRL